MDYNKYWWVFGIIFVVLLFGSLQLGINMGYNKGYDDGLSANPQVITKLETKTDYIDRIVFKEIPCPPCAGATSNTTQGR